MLLDTADQPVHIQNTPTHLLCRACGSVVKKLPKRKGPPPMVAPNPYDQPVQVDPTAQALIDQGKEAVRQAKLKAKRQEFAERAAKWSAERIREEMVKIDEAVKAHEAKIAECLRQRMILEDQLAQAQAPAPVVKTLPKRFAQPLDDAEPTSDCPF